MMDLEQRVAELEQLVQEQGEKIAAIELALKSGKSNLQYIIDTWQDVIVNFADTYGVESPKLNDVLTSLKQKE